MFSSEKNRVGEICLNKNVYKLYFARESKYLKTWRRKTSNEAISDQAHR